MKIDINPIFFIGSSAKWGISDAENYAYLNGGQCISVDGIDDAEEFILLKVKKLDIIF